jgi:hypothetical protein
MLHFAYGSNMHRAVMRRHAPAAAPVGVAELADYRFIITADGYASVEPMRAHRVHGVLWRLTPPDRVTLNAWENVAGGLYRAETLLVYRAGRRWPVLVYVGRPRHAGRPKAGYMELVIAAAREWKLPQAYVDSLRQWLPTRSLRAGARQLGEFGWT